MRGIDDQLDDLREFLETAAAQIKEVTSRREVFVSTKAEFGNAREAALIEDAGTLARLELACHAYKSAAAGYGQLFEGSGIVGAVGDHIARSLRTLITPRTDGSEA